MRWQKICHQSRKITVAKTVARSASYPLDRAVRENIILTSEFRKFSCCRLLCSSLRDYFNRRALLIAVIAISPLSTLAADFKTYDMMGFDFVPSQHSDKGLEKVPVLYECTMFRGDYVAGVNNCNHIDYRASNDDVVRQRASENIGNPVVAIDIETEVWDLSTKDLSFLVDVVQRWMHMLTIWREVNPDTTILIYGGMPKIYWALLTSNIELLQLYQQQTTIIAPLFAIEGVELWPSAYVNTDSPDVYRTERKWQIYVCHNVYKTRCYFAIYPYYRKYVDSGTGHRLPMDQSSFLEIMNTLKEDGADGFGLWIHPGHLADDYEQRMKEWSWQGGATGLMRDRDMSWLSAVEKFLDNKPNSGPTGTYTE